MAEFFPSSRLEMAQDGLAPSGDKVVRHPVASRIAALGAAPADARQYFLLLRFSLINLVGFALLGAAWVQGWVSLAWTSDTTYLSHGIFALFLAGLGVCGHKIWHTSRELNKARRFDPIHNPEQSMALRYVSEVRGRSGDSRALAASSLKLKLTTRIGVVRFIANSLVLLGLIGTVVGFIMALSGVDPETSGDASAITPMVSTLIVGMSVALYTTLIGSVLNVWLMINYHILASGTVNLLTTLVDLGERHGRA